MRVTSKVATFIPFSINIKLETADDAQRLYSLFACRKLAENTVGIENALQILRKIVDGCENTIVSNSKYNEWVIKTIG